MVVWLLRLTPSLSHHGRPWSHGSVSEKNSCGLRCRPTDCPCFATAIGLFYFLSSVLLLLPFFYSIAIHLRRSGKIGKAFNFYKIYDTRLPLGWLSSITHNIHTYAGGGCEENTRKTGARGVPFEGPTFLFSRPLATMISISLTKTTDSFSAPGSTTDKNTHYGGTIRSYTHARECLLLL